MKNLNSLIIVLCLLIILGCKCQSEAFDKFKGESSPTPSATPSATSSATPSPSATPKGRSASNDDKDDDDESENSRLATGTYTGKGKNLTINKSGDFLLRVESVSSSGKVKAYLEASNGLTGSADMEGTISNAGKLELSGTLSDGQSAAISGTVTGDKISAGFGLADSNLKTQSGNFTLTRR